jgi:hypothetical protein
VAHGTAATRAASALSSPGIAALRSEIRRPPRDKILLRLFVWRACVDDAFAAIETIGRDAVPQVGLAGLLIN